MKEAVVPKRVDGISIGLVGALDGVAEGVAVGAAVGAHVMPQHVVPQTARITN